MRSITSFIEDNIVLCPPKRNDVQAKPEMMFATLSQNDVVSCGHKYKKDIQKDVFFDGGPSGTRTRDRSVMSRML